MKHAWRALLVGLLLGGGWQPAVAQQAELAEKGNGDLIQQAFYPYAVEKPALAGLGPGTSISADSWQAAESYLPAEILDKIKAGEFAFSVQETTDLPVSEAYIEATRQHAGQVQIGDDGELSGYVAGLPFPVLDPADPQAGEKAAWNVRHRDLGDTIQVWNTFRLLDASGEADREFENYYVVAQGMHRPRAEANRWEEDGVLQKEFFHMITPFDLKNTMSLKHRFAKDGAKDADWMYTPASRKIRKLIVKHEDASFDSGFLNEDFFGYSGYISASSWKLLGSRLMLAPVGAKAAATTFGGRGTWYPVDPWELRHMWVLENIPKASDHPYSKRLLYIDRQMFVPVYMLAYDRNGTHHKTLFELYGNPQFNPGNEHIRAPMWIGESMIDYENNFASMTEVDKVVYDQPLPDDFFQLNQIVARGR